VKRLEALDTAAAAAMRNEYVCRGPAKITFAEYRLIAAGPRASAKVICYAERASGGIVAW
jgi:hypothetical protein